MSTLTLTGRSDLAGVSGDIDDVSRSVRDLADDVSRVDDVARTSGAGLDTLADSSDAVASRSSQAAGGLGDLAGGLGAIGATGAAGALEGVAVAAQTAVGAGDILNLVAETTVGRYVAQTAASIAHRTATIAGTVATGAMTAAQTALNLVLSANPIALLVLGLVAATAAIILLWRNSDTFREIVQRAFEVATAGIRATIEVIETIVGWFKDLPGVVRDAAGVVKDKVADMFQPIETAIDWVADLVDDLKTAPGNAADAVARSFGRMFAPIETALGWIQDLIDKAKSLTDIDINPFNGRRAVDASESPVGDRDLGREPVVVAVNLTVAPTDRDAAIADLVDGLREYFARRGQTLSLTEAPAA